MSATRRRGDAGARRARDRPTDLGVKIEAKFTVGEYEIVILSREGLDGPRDLAAREQLQDPRRAPSRCCGRTSRAASKFFVAKVDPTKVKFENGQRGAVAAALPLRRDEFALPIRLGLANSSGHAGPDRQHPRAGQALRGRELPERHDPDEPRRRGRA